MPTDRNSGWVEPDIVINGRALTFAECMSVRVAIGSFRLSLQDREICAGIGTVLACNYDHHLASVERTMLSPEPRDEVVGLGERRRKNPHEPQQWPIGTPVTVQRGNGDLFETKTRSQPWLLSGHTWVILVQGISGCYALDRVTER